MISDEPLETQHLKAVKKDSDQASHQCNMQILEIPFAPRENLGGILESLVAKLQMEDFQPSHVEAAHSPHAKRDVMPPILIRFS